MGTGAAGLLLTIAFVLPAHASISQVHLAMGKTSSTMVVSWVTSTQSDSLVRFGTSDSLSSSATGNSSFYSSKSVPRQATAFAEYTSPFIHHVHLNGLSSSTKYFYRIGTDGRLEWFTTPPAPGEAKPLTIAMVGDLGQTSDSASTIHHVLEDSSASIMLHAGDMSYADCDGARWDSYFAMIEPLSKRLPWMVTAGNHEIEPDGTGEIMAAFKRRCAMPEVAPGVDQSQVFQDPKNTGYDCTPSAFTGDFDFGNSFYSFELGLAHVVVLNSYVQTKVGSAQYKWLEHDLKEVDTTQTPWIMAMFHSPWYNSNHDHQSEFNTVAMRAAMEPLFQQYNVSLAICGHVHAYERSAPVYKNQTTPTGTTYFNIGDGGNREGHSSSWLESPGWSANHDGTMFGHSRLTVENRTHALFEWIPNDGTDWIIRDSVWVRNLNG